MSPFHLAYFHGLFRMDFFIVLILGLRQKLYILSLYSHNPLALLASSTFWETGKMAGLPESGFL